MVYKSVERIFGVSEAHLNLQIILSILLYSRQLCQEFLVNDGNRKQKIKQFN